MKTALFLSNDKLDETDIDMMPIVILHIEGKSVKEVEKDLIVKKDINFLSLWLITNKISEVYVMDIAPTIKNLFERLGVKVKRHDEMPNNALLRSILEE